MTPNPPSPPLPPRALIVIPARFGSTRFPGKPLLKETGKFLIQHVVEQAQRVLSAGDIVVATDDQRIFDAVRSFGAPVVMTSDKHPSGTDRIAEVVNLPPYRDAQIIVNVQGDEPEIDPGLIHDLIDAMVCNSHADMATAGCPFERMEDVANPNMVKLVADEKQFALYFSRAAIPFDRDKSVATPAPYRKHLGLYAYRRAAILRLAAAPPSPLEQLEKLEQLRALHLGMKIHVTMTTHAPHGIDTPADYAAFIQRLEAAK